MKTKKYTAWIVAIHSRISLTGQLCQNTDNSMMMRFKDTYSVKGIAKTLLALILVSDFCYSTETALVVLWWRNVGEVSSCVWFDSRMALPVTKVWYGDAWLQDNCSVPSVWCPCQQAKTENSYRYEVTSFEKQLTTPGILGFLQGVKGTVFCVNNVFWWGKGAKEPQAELVLFWTNQQFWHDWDVLKSSRKLFD